ncbi:MAG: hypothetical protein ACR5LC_10150 [Symbiopectobacterium sp.]
MAKHFTAEFKLETEKLVVEHGYTYVKAAVYQRKYEEPSYPVP